MYVYTNTRQQSLLYICVCNVSILEHGNSKRRRQLSEVSQANEMILIIDYSSFSKTRRKQN